MEPLRTVDRHEDLWIAARFLAAAGLSWLTPVGHLLAAQAERSREPARSIILLWLAGGPSQLETFDPHPGTARRRRHEGDRHRRQGRSSSPRDSSSSPIRWA